MFTFWIKHFIFIYSCGLFFIVSHLFLKSLQTSVSYRILLGICSHKYDNLKMLGHNCHATNKQYFVILIAFQNLKTNFVFYQMMLIYFEYFVRLLSQEFKVFCDDKQMQIFKKSVIDNWPF